MRNNNENQSSLVLFATVGFCGGFTTFSSFANENLSFVRSGDFNYVIGLQYVEFNDWNSYGLSQEFWLTSLFTDFLRIS